uniref:Uncharacterized protein n=1 Tax=Globisporangium ultimum (strain ATCC 200006 / CBS 805.95 / DAOM BR144) TaxID=431595 RepID=K3WQ55_GLOUD
MDPQLGGYPPDCGTKELKYLSYAKMLHDHGETHSIRYLTTEFDLVPLLVECSHQRRGIFCNDMEEEDGSAAL